MVFGTHSICSVSFCDVHLRGGGGGGASESVLTCVRASRLSDDGEPRSVNATRRDRMTCFNDMLLCRDDQ